MSKAKVYFADFKVTAKENLLQKLTRLAKTAGIEQIDFRNKFTAVKIHFGEMGNLSYLRPNYARAIVDLVKAAGGQVFLTDCNTLYVGKRKNALDHLDTAYQNGFNPFTVGCHILIADGLKGTDEALIPIEGQYVQEAKIGQAIADADIIISLTHFKLHELTGAGGTLKNLGMGCGSRAGKMEMHSDGRPQVNSEKCISCGSCRKNCAHEAISFIEKKAHIDQNICKGCGRCIGVCPVDAIAAEMDSNSVKLNCKIAEYTKAVLQDKPSFHISLIVDVSPFCDCHAENDIPIISDVGMLASFDPVALDQACVDLVKAQKPNPQSVLGDVEPGSNYFKAVYPHTDYASCFEHAVKIGLGSREYELIKI